MLRVLSKQLKIKLFLAMGMIALLLCAMGYWYLSFYTKTPEYAVKMIQEALAEQDVEKFHKYVDLDKLLDGSCDDLMTGLIEAEKPLSPDAKAAVSGFTKMFKAPLVASFKGLINNYVETGTWGEDDSKVMDQGIPIDSDIVLNKSGLKEIEFRQIDSIESDAEAGTAIVHVRVYQQEAEAEFVLDVQFVRNENNVWRAENVMNFHDFIVFVSEARQKQMGLYLEQTANITGEHEIKVQKIQQDITEAMSQGTLGTSAVRNKIKTIMLEEMVPEWEKRKAALSAVNAPGAAKTLHNLRLKICDLEIEYAKKYAEWMDDKNAKTIHEAEEKLRQAKTLTHEETMIVMQAKNRLQTKK